MRRHLLIGLAGLAAVYVALIIFWHSSPMVPLAPEAPREPSPPADETPPPPPAPLGALPVTGRVLDSDLRPVAGIEIACGEETAVSGADGVFEFPPARRPGRRALAIRRAGNELIRWEDIITGETGPAVDGPPAASQWAAGGADLRPEMIRWTITLGAGTLGPGLPGPGRPDAPPPPGKPPAPGPVFIEMSATLIEEWGPTGEALVAGTTSLPDGAHLQAALLLMEERVVSSIENTAAAAGAFRSRIRFPDDFRIHPASYDLHLIFAVSQEDPVEMEGWLEKVPDLPAELDVVRKVFAGTPAEELAENRKIEAHFGEILDGINRLQKVLLASVNKGRLLAGSWDPEVLRAEVELEQASFAGGLLDASGKFDFGAWRRFLDEGLRPEVRRLIELHQRRRCGKFNNAENLLEGALKRFLRLSRIRSTLVYSAWGKEVPVEDFDLDEEGAEGDEVINAQILQKDLEILQKYRSLTTGQEKPKPAGAEDEDQSSR